jgi:predicted  nucleic acid-binding Zn-ribbon protein
MDELIVKGLSMLNIESLSDSLPLVTSVLGGLILKTFNGVRNDLKDLNKSVQELNIEVAKVLSDQSWHREQIKEIKDRLSDLEKRGE